MALVLKGINKASDRAWGEGFNDIQKIISQMLVLKKSFELLKFFDIFALVHELDALFKYRYQLKFKNFSPNQCTFFAQSSSPHWSFLNRERNLSWIKKTKSFYYALDINN